MPGSQLETLLDITLPEHLLHARKLGSGPRLLVCLHGLLDSGKIWQPLAQRIGKESSLLLPDQRGHGNSGSPPGPIERENLADDVIGALDALQVDRAVLVGHSMGGIVSLTTALRHPDRVSALVLLGTASQCNEKTAHWYEKIARAGDQGGLQGLAEAVYGPGSKRKILGDAPAICAVTRMLKSLYQRPLTPELSHIGCPTLVLVGSQDPMKPRASEIIADAIPGSVFRVLEGQGHWPHLKAPETVSNAMDSWLDHLAESPAPTI